MLKPTSRILLVLLSLTLSYSLALGAPPSSVSGSKSELGHELKQQPKDLFGIINGIVANNVRKCLAALPASMAQASQSTSAQVKATVDATKQLLDLELQRCGSLQDPSITDIPSSLQLCFEESLAQGPTQAQLLATQQSVGYLLQKLGTTMWTEVAACLAPLQLPTSVLQSILDNGKFSESDAEELLAKHTHLGGVKRDTAAVKALAKDLTECLDALTKTLTELGQQWSKSLEDIVNINQGLVKLLKDCGNLNLLCIGKAVNQVITSFSSLVSKIVGQVKDTVSTIGTATGNFITCAIDSVV